ncbi:GNAT family N-acetyltransferase [Nocardia goodfellowii]|uniref:GNAT superfamily N-acetyltransferase n=1 Tax=Nocardia goodfellowii TaxID=882446 RepID=A0ABS4QNV2_9NOCA|nr:GNAT family N-acetyltransferase [Nocardia goodfellowii]MBP2193382.1 GNAT superfamily N-acetyltransferase [Nocardia goodfellowii]
MIAIGPPQPADRPAWERLFQGYNAFYGRETMPDGFYDRVWTEFRSGARMHALGAKLEGELVGLAHFFAHPSTTSADVCYLQDLFTAPAARGKGVARQLIAAVRSWAAEQDCAQVYWHTKQDNHAARLLYDKVAENRGFIQYVLPV